MAQQSLSLQQQSLRQRLPVVVTVLVIASFALLMRLIWFQSPQDPRVIGYLETIRDANYRREQRLPGERGNIYDRNGEPLAVNAIEYEVGISPNLISNAERAATQLGTILNLDEVYIYNLIRTSPNQWELLARPVSAEVGQQVAQLDLLGVIVNPIPRRSYPQGTLAAPVLGFVGEDADGLRGYFGVEGQYEDQLAGRVSSTEVSNIPFDIPEDTTDYDNDGVDLVLTLDREIQALAEAELLQAVTETGANPGGVILIMNPRNGDILAMASYPSFDPNNITASDDTTYRNRAIAEVFEPGSVMKVVTVASALESGVITPGWTYVDNGVISVGGVDIYNWDRGVHGTTDVTQVLVESLNVGAATISTTMGPLTFFEMLGRFGFGRPTGVDLEGEEAGTMWVPGDSDYNDSLVGTVAFGQGIAVTPLQMLTAVNAIANGGLMYQPRIVYQIIDGPDVITPQPVALGRPISAETASIVTNMMVAVIEDGVDNPAALPGYTIAGKTGTAQIPNAIGYEEDTSRVWFVGFLPADDPQVSVLIMLDRPTTGYWASEVVAPIFARLAQRLVILLEIPPDDVRHALEEEGGSVDGISR
jgi:cell division protein FtsI/penicillin-binding protein 2